MYHRSKGRREAITKAGRQIKRKGKGERQRGDCKYLCYIHNERAYIHCLFDRLQMHHQQLPTRHKAQDQVMNAFHLY